MFEDLWIVEYVDVDGISHWVDKEGNVCKDAVEMSHSEAVMARDSFLDSANPVVVYRVMSGSERVEISLAEEEK